MAKQKSNKKGAEKKSPSLDPLQKALKDSAAQSEKAEKEAAEKAAKLNAEKEAAIKKAFDPAKAIKNAHLPTGTTEVWVTEDGQVFLKQGPASTHAANKRLKLIEVKL